MRFMRYILFFLVFLSSCLLRSENSQSLKIQGNQFLLDEQLFEMWGVRVASASQNEDYTKQLITSLDEYKDYGINTISVFFQGSSGGFSDPFSPDGRQIDEEHLNRMIRIIKECNKRDMVVITGIFYQRTMENINGVRKLSDGEAVVNAVRLITEKLKPHRNVIINIANEQNSVRYRNFEYYDFTDPVNIIRFCREVHLIDPERITGGGGYNDKSNIIIGKSPDVDVLLFDTYSKDIEEGKHSGWKYDYFRGQGVPDIPIVNVEIFGGWTAKFIPPGVYTDEGKQIHIQEIIEAKKRPGLYVHFHSNPWFQGPSLGEKARFDLGGAGTANDPGIKWWADEINK